MDLEHRGLIKLSSFYNKYIFLIFRLILGIIFIWASIDKIFNPQDFAKIVYNYRLLPDFAINIFGIVLPWTEFLCGLFLVAGFRTRRSALIISILLLVFIIAISIAIIRGLDISCGCFTTDPAESSKIGYTLLWRDSLMLLIGIYLIGYSSDFLSLTAVLKR